MNLVKSIRKCFQNYAEFSSGRASRSEFWWFFVFVVVGSLLLSAGAEYNENIQLLFAVFTLVTIIPLYAVGSRRLHDIGKSGRWQYLVFLPHTLCQLMSIAALPLIITFPILAYLWSKMGDQQPNQFGAIPLLSKA